jgi:phosphatidylglycerophosphate synthase
MFDASLNRLLKRPLVRLAGALLRLGLTPDTMSWIGFVIGLAALPLIATGRPDFALACIALNRLADGLDGAMARLGQPTDRGAFLDISLDFLFYSSIPLAFALADPGRNGLAAAVLIYAFVGTGSTFLAFAVIAAKRGLTSTAFPSKGFHYLGGLTESTETLVVFSLMCLMPAWFIPLALGFAALCAVTVVTRIAAGLRAFRN